ncbi:glycosyltransferase family 4 protein [Corallincola platygyrae]|uniref:Glycosyltransferase family 4 protein n=1 Tax=Corallincola platygyrae TaxID=1193278 RepID=A0ABW4XRZ9_9GAMM
MSEPDSTQVLIIGYVWPEPNSSAAGSHMMSLIRLFLAQGWRVCFASPAQQTEHMVDLTELGVEVQAIPLNDSAFDHFVSELAPDIVLFDRFMMEEQFGWRVSQQCPDALKLLDTEDLHSLRHARHTAHKAHREMNSADLTNDYALREIASIYRCDLSLIISDFEQTLLKEHYGVPEQLLFHCPFMLDLENQPQAKREYEQRSHFVSIGNFRHAPNWDAVLWLKQSLWPKIRKQLPEAELHIYGAYPPPKATALHDPQKGFLVKGWAPDADVVIVQSRVLLAPLRFGAGIKGKLADAMRLGTPSVTTSVGAEGMASQEHWPGAVADNEDSFVASAVQLYSNAQDWQLASEKSLDVLYAKFDGKLIAARLLNQIETLRHDLAKHRLSNFTGAMLRHHHHRSTQFMAQWIESKNRLKALAENDSEEVGRIDG